MPENMIEERERNAAQLIDSTIIRKLVIKNEMTEVERLCDFVMSFCQQLSVTNKCANNVCLAVEEAIVNVINYAYPHGTQGRISIMTDRKRLRLSSKTGGSLLIPLRWQKPM